MLPATAVGTIEFRSLLEPVRVANPFVDYFEATCDKIDLEGKVGPHGGGRGRERWRDWVAVSRALMVLMKAA